MEDNKFQIEVLSRLSILETLIKEQDYKGVKEKAEMALNKSTQNEKEIENLKNTNTWLIRTIIALVISSAFYIVFKIK